MILVKEEFVGGEKWRRAVKLAASDAIVMWVVMKCYCCMHPNTEGFVPDEDLDGLPGVPRNARKALQALIDCGRLLPGGARGPGLVEPAEGGWLLHDYLDHSASPEEIELRRAKARLKKQKQRDDQRRELAALRRQSEAIAGGHVPGDTGGHVPGDTGGHVPGDTPRDGLTGASPREPAPTRGGAHPSPSHPSPTQIKSLALTSTIRSARGRAGGPAAIADVMGCGPPPQLAPPVAASLEPSAEHRRFAADHGLDLAHFVAELRGDPSAAALTPGLWGKRLAGRLMSAATDHGSITAPAAMGGAA